MAKYPQSPYQDVEDLLTKCWHDIRKLQNKAHYEEELGVIDRAKRGLTELITDIKNEHEWPSNWMD